MLTSMTAVQEVGYMLYKGECWLSHALYSRPKTNTRPTTLGKDVTLNDYSSRYLAGDQP